MESINRIEPDHPSIAAVDQCAGDPNRLFDVALSSMMIAKSSDSLVSDPVAVQCIITAALALSGLVDTCRQRDRIDRLVSRLRCT